MTGRCRWARTTTSRRPTRRWRWTAAAAAGATPPAAALLALHHLAGGACSAAVRLLGLDPIAVAAVQARAVEAATGPAHEAATAAAVLREEVVLCRTGQHGGRFRGELTVELEGVPLLAHTLLLDGADPALTGPAGTGGCRAVGTLLVVSAGPTAPAEGAGEQPGLRLACSALAGPGRLLLAVGGRATDLARLLDQAAQKTGAGLALPWTSGA